jgi:hypothetical protein
MAKAQSQKSPLIDASPGRLTPESPVMPAAELMSFLKEAGVARTWTETELANTLKIGLPQAKQAIAVLQLQGYIEQVGRTSKWKVTEEGHLVYGARPARFTAKNVSDAIAGLRDRIKAVNDDPNAPYKIAEAVAFGDFLGDAERVQAAEVGIRLVARSDAAGMASATEHAAELEFLRQVRGKTALLHVVRYENWMSSRSHLRLL